MMQQIGRHGAGGVMARAHLTALSSLPPNIAATRTLLPLGESVSRRIDLLLPACCSNPRLEPSLGATGVLRAAMVAIGLCYESSAASKVADTDVGRADPTMRYRCCTGVL